MKDLDANTFDKAIQEAKFAVVDFWADWCVPCKRVAPILEELSEEYKGKVEFFKLNVDENPEIASKMKIISIPTMIIFKEGKPVDKIVGALPKQSIKEAIDRNLE
uniref:Thioredoxin n=1 Tax=Fervidobacterium pennivorans TaxID=93466 RepID=A0A7V4KCU4_FERPE